MFYEPLKTTHGLAHDPFKSCVVPRPIGWISTISRNGLHNLALQPVPESDLRSAICDVLSQPEYRGQKKRHGCKYRDYRRICP